MPASRRTSASEHDEELASHLQGLSLAGERAAAAQQAAPQSILRSTAVGFGPGSGVNYGFNAGMMLDEQLDQEMQSTCNMRIARRLRG